jgi:hypothetical protein
MLLLLLSFCVSPARSESDVYEVEGAVRVPSGSLPSACRLLLRGANHTQIVTTARDNGQFVMSAEMAAAPVACCLPPALCCAALR